MEPGPIKGVDKEMPVGARSNIFDLGRVRELANSSQFGGFVVLGKLRCSCWNETRTKAVKTARAEVAMESLRILRGLH